MERLSAVVITLNETGNIAKCLAALQRVADEIIVVDSYSKDDTVQLAKANGATVIQRQFDGYGSQKAAGLAMAQHNWHMVIDADEVLSDELTAAILNLKNGEARGAYKMKRLTNYCGHWVRHGGWYPDEVLRLWWKGDAFQNEEALHEKVDARDNVEIKTLSGDLLHYSFPTINSHLQKVQDYTSKGAAVDIARGKTVSLLKLCCGPAWVFIVMYLLKSGWRDGFYGFVIAKISAFAAFVKYAKVRKGDT